MISDDTVILDLTQFYGDPVASGIQRVLRELFLHLHPSAPIAVAFRPRGADHYRLSTRNAALEAMELVFHEKSDRFAATRLLLCQASQTISVDSLIKSTRGYLLPEPTDRPDLLGVAERCFEYRPESTFAIAYDTLPALAPVDFPQAASTYMSRYYRWLVQVPNIAAISQSSLDQLSVLSRRSIDGNWVVALPGADGIRRDPNAVPEPESFVALGTVEPRKNIDVVIDAFEMLWREGNQSRLTIVGRPGWSVPALIEKLVVLEKMYPERLLWLKNCNDEALRHVLLGSSALLYLSEREGYGLPPLEALWLGRPVVVSTKLPAMDGIASGGQIRLADVTPSAVADAVLSLIDPGVYQLRRSEIRSLNLPTWKNYGQAITDWLATGLRSSVPQKSVD